MKKRTSTGVTKRDVRKLAKELKREAKHLLDIDLRSLTDRQRQMAARTLRPAIAAVHALVVKLSTD
jgi:hypothetical protein